ncbi:MAG: hypothetical protein QGH73_18975 [Rhodospirillales bacterium]|nr:hypothetical protein [Rhodospirillales bacterium]MDP6645062.1 hypothetical protein [Rhodospirillales bacterium]MDP6843759.1 hypothetical protein [Rhodospirillales bacterium]
MDEQSLARLGEAWILGGWSRNRFGFEGVYGDGLKVETLKREIEKVSYAGLDQSHL